MLHGSYPLIVVARTLVLNSGASAVLLTRTWRRCVRSARRTALWRPGHLIILLRALRHITRLTWESCAPSTRRVLPSFSALVLHVDKSFYSCSFLRKLTRGDRQKAGGLMQASERDPIWQKAK